MNIIRDHPLSLAYLALCFTVMLLTFIVEVIR